MDLGICSRLDQVFDAPNAVKEVLISQFGLDKSVCYFFCSVISGIFFVSRLYVH